MNSYHGRSLFERRAFSERGRWAPGVRTMPVDISVIVSAYRRRRAYLEDALASLAAQTLPADRFEVIVVKGFTDPSVEGALRNYGYVGLPIDDMKEPSGATWVRGIRRAQGRYLTFLEDDDKFTPGRLEAVLEAFRADPALTFYRNSFTLIDAEGLPLGPGVEEPPLAADAYLPAGDRRARDLRFVMVRTPPSAPSTMALARSALDGNLGTFQKVHWGPDQFLFVAGLASGGAMRMDHRRFTLSRVHPAQSTDYHPTHFEERYVHERGTRFRRGLSEWEAMRAGFSGPLPAGARTYLDTIIAIRALETVLFEAGTRRRDVARVLPSVLSAAVRFRSSWCAQRLAWGTSGLLWPGLPLRYELARERTVRREFLAGTLRQ